MIYFVTAREVGRVKIGYAKEPQARFVSIQTHSPVTLVLERVCEGNAEEEARLHERFAADRVRGEWFVITPEIERFLESLPRHEWKGRGWHHAARRAALVTRDPAA
jgi:tRNA isopentenyl-2-thiomethyl-A-37 hydroxylase MiaE